MSTNGGFFDCGVNLNGFVFNNCSVSHKHSLSELDKGLFSGCRTIAVQSRSLYRVIRTIEWKQGHEEDSVTLLQCSECSQTIPRDFFIAYLRLFGSPECQPYIEGRI